MQQPGEPSVEEILDSIKKVIARDNREGAIIERRRRAAEDAPRETAQSFHAEEPAEVLELGEGEMVGQDDDGYNGSDVAWAEDDAGIDVGSGANEALIGGETSESMRQNLAALAMISKPGKQPQIVRSGETSLEGLTRELLRPLLAQWLDANLPGMVEELVKAEIARIAGKRS